MTRALLFILVVGCGGASTSASVNSSTNSPTSSAPATMSRPEGGPALDQDLATWARTDPPPFPPDQLIRLIQPVGGRLAPSALAQIASFIRWYERDPFDPRIGMNLDVSVRATLLAWLTESPDVSVTITNVLGELMSQRSEGDGPLRASATIGSLLGMAAHAIEQPQHAPESYDRMVAGVSSALRWYTAARAREGTQSSVMDELVVAEQEGRLAEVLSELVGVTREPDSPNVH